MRLRLIVLPLQLLKEFIAVNVRILIGYREHIVDNLPVYVMTWDGVGRQRSGLNPVHPVAISTHVAALGQYDPMGGVSVD